MGRTVHMSWPRIAGVFAALFALASCAPSDRAASDGARATAPLFSAIDLEGKPVALTALRGQVVVLNLWATWCQPCRAEIPQLVALHREFAPRGVTVVGVSVDAAGMGSDVADFMREHDMTYPVWLDPDRKFSLAFHTIGVPETFVLDRQGVIRHRVIGGIAPGDTTLATAIRQVLGP